MRKLFGKFVILAVSILNFSACSGSSEDPIVFIDERDMPDVIGCYEIHNIFGNGSLELLDNHTFKNRFYKDSSLLINEGKWDCYYKYDSEEYEILFTNWIWWYPVDSKGVINDIGIETLIYKNGKICNKRYLVGDSLVTFFKACK